MFLCGLIITGFIAIGWIWSKPVRKIENEEGILLSIDQLCLDFTNNKTMADSLYLNKAIKLKGEITELSNTLDGATMMIFTASNNMDDVECILREKSSDLKVGNTINVKGFCAGKTTTGISLTDCIVVP